MKQIIFDAHTGETTITEVPNEEMSVVEEIQPPTAEERLQALEQAMLELVLGGVV